ncbi:MAG TPA: RnfABCDGE type electron transport complex subunit D [Tepidisphaeraceae bacterium]|jgi:Na+-translocating ferredoxin:NAD+ oxidoreductase RnfD subunit|nr:RnfABCDGE type electron transport complex subunit D [Tepidisphaeraceae bacterium]
MTTAALPRPAEITALPHSGLSVAEFYSMHFMAALVPVTAGLLLYGWRAAVAMLLVGLGTTAGVAVWRRIGSRGKQLSYPHAMWLALLLAMMLPAHLASGPTATVEQASWYLLPAAGLLLAIFLWILGGLGAGRVNPVLITYLFIAALFVQLLVPHWVLQRNHLFVGDVLNGVPSETRSAETDPWTHRYKIPGRDAEYSAPASEALTRYTATSSRSPRGWLPIQSLLRDELPPLEDLIIGGHPGPIGAGSAVAVIMGGLFLLYRGLIDFRIPLIIIMVEMACLLIFPTPSLLSEPTQWHWIVSRRPEVGWATGITFANYELMASPSLFMAFFLATAPSIRPMSHRARIIYATVAGAGTAALQLYMSVSIGPYLALLIASLMTPALDMWFRPKAMI